VKHRPICRPHTASAHRSRTLGLMTTTLKACIRKSHPTSPMHWFHPGYAGKVKGVLCNSMQWEFSSTDKKEFTCVYWPSTTKPWKDSEPQLHCVCACFTMASSRRQRVNWRILIIVGDFGFPVYIPATLESYRAYTFTKPHQGLHPNWPNPSIRNR
jgi:hypothetical protein